MAAAPKVDFEQLGTVIDAMATTNALMFMAGASDEQIDAVLRLLDLVSKQKTDKGAKAELRNAVVSATANAVRQIQGMRQGNDPAAGAAST
ncbi:hypothetical protein NX81_011930 [Xanthomonas vasicola]|uniref:hypothetical protein n=1 Tax=Xanthomonas vasicola TaxID=56459 RepID=UPI00053121D2|nr:hypothetical protein [Xanthomonas vasicola]AZR22910.1 hypothetical protein NX81_011930 [Xanthomonas vasicola]